MGWKCEVFWLLVVTFLALVYRWQWGNLSEERVSPHPFQKLFLRILRMLRFFYFFRFVFFRFVTLSWNVTR